MIHYVQCLKAREGMPVLEFRTRFREYSEKMRAIAAAIGAIRVESSSTLAVEANLRVMSERGTHAPYDAVLNVYLPNAGVLDALAQPDTAALVEDAQAFQDSFVDLERSSFFFAAVDEG